MKRISASDEQASSYSSSNSNHLHMPAMETTLQLVVILNCLVAESLGYEAVWLLAGRIMTFKIHFGEQAKKFTNFLQGYKALSGFPQSIEMGDKDSELQR